MAIVLSTHGAFPFEKAIKKAKVAGKTGTGWDDSYIRNAHAGHVTIFFIDATNKADALSKIAQAKPYSKKINNVYYFGDESERAITRAIENRINPNFVRETTMKKSELREIIREEVKNILLKETNEKTISKDIVDNFEKVLGFKPGQLFQGHGFVNFTKPLLKMGIPRIKKYVKEKYNVNWDNLSDIQIIDKVFNDYGFFNKKYRY